MEIILIILNKYQKIKMQIARKRLRLIRAEYKEHMKGFSPNQIAPEEPTGEMSGNQNLQNF